MLIIFKFLFHFICSIGRFLRKVCQLIIGRRHEELSTSLSKTEPVTLEHIRIISDMENGSNRSHPSLTGLPKVNYLFIYLFSHKYCCSIRYHQQNGILGVLKIYLDKKVQIIPPQLTQITIKSIILVILLQLLKKHLK